MAKMMTHWEGMKGIHGKAEKYHPPPILDLESEPLPFMSPRKLLSSGPRAISVVGTFYEYVEGVRGSVTMG